MPKSMRSIKLEEDHKTDRVKTVEVAALRKVFYIPSGLLSSDKQLKVEKFYHPGKGKPTFFMTCEHKKSIMEIVEFAEPRRSWLINQNVCSNGKLYLTTPIDTTFLALYHIRKHCSQNALALDCIRDDQDTDVGRLLMTYVTAEQLKCIADAKTAGEEMIFYKYNAKKAFAWLALKVQRVVEAFRRNDVYCGVSALSLNYKKGDVGEQSVQDVDVLRMACDYVGAYLDLELHTELLQYLSLPADQESREQKSKRKSLQALSGSENKKFKVDPNETAAENLQNNILDDSFSESAAKSEPTETMFMATPIKEKTLTTKDKAFAKSAKGSKSISSFFKRGT